MANRLGTALLMATTAAWGVLLGGVVYSHIVFFPVYLSDLPESAVLVNGRYGLNDGAFWSIVHPILILLLIGTLVSHRRVRVRRNLLLVSASIYFVALVVTLLYFFPGLQAFQNSPDLSIEPSVWLMRGRRWLRFSWIRGGMMLLGFFPLLFAFRTSVDRSSPSGKFATKE